MTFEQLVSEHRCTHSERLELWAHLCLLRYQKALKALHEAQWRGENVSYPKKGRKA